MERRSFLATATAIPSAVMSTNSFNLFPNTENNSKMLQPFHIPYKEALQPGPGGIDIRTLVKSSATNLQYSSTETAVIGKMMGPPPHSHKELDEILYVTDGVCTVWIDEKIYTVKSQEWFFMPRNSIHTFWNGESKPLRFIGMYFNQNFEDYLEELFHKIVPNMVSKNLSPIDKIVIEQMNDLNNRFGVTMYPEKRQPIIEKYGLKG